MQSLRTTRPPENPHCPSPMANLSDHDLKQMDEAWQSGQPEPVLRGLLKRALDDLRTARDRLNQRPDNSSRPPGSMPPWQRGGGAGGEASPEDAPGTEAAPSGEPASDTGSAQEKPAETGATDGTASAVQCPPATPPRGRPGRRVGAPGHGREQKIEATRAQEHRPQCCAACQQALPRDGQVQAWTGWDTLEMMPLSADEGAAPTVLGVRIEVTRHLLMQQRCACGHITQAQAVRADEDALWPGVEISQQRLLGPRLAAAVVHLCVRMRLPRRKVSELLLEWFGLELSAALIDQTVHQAARSVAPLEQQLAEQLEAATIVYVDETSWPEAGQPLWLWVLCCCHTVLYMIGSRGKEMFDNALSTDFGGTLMSDGYGVYRARLLRLRCWAHLHRKLRGLAESTDPLCAMAGGAMQQIFDELIRAIFQARQAQGPPPAVTHALQIEQLRQLCEQHRDASHKALRELAREFLNDWHVIVRQLADPKLPLTNNAAERQLRHFVIARRISYGTRTPVGSHSVALLASIIDTCRLRGASATDLLARAIHAARMGLSAPVLPPIPSALALPSIALAAA
jgi:transposase